MHTPWHSAYFVGIAHLSFCESIHRCCIAKLKMHNEMIIGVSSKSFFQISTLWLQNTSTAAFWMPRLVFLLGMPISFSMKTFQNVLWLGITQPCWVCITVCFSLFMSVSSHAYLLTRSIPQVILKTTVFSSSRYLLHWPAIEGVFCGKHSCCVCFQMNIGLLSLDLSSLDGAIFDGFISFACKPPLFYTLQLMKQHFSHQYKEYKQLLNWVK